MRIKKVVAGIYEVQTELGVCEITKAVDGQEMCGMKAQWFIELPLGYRPMDEMYETLRTAKEMLAVWVADNIRR